jgi:S1-C subfamily serine protease
MDLNDSHKAAIKAALAVLIGVAALVGAFKYSRPPAQHTLAVAIPLKNRHSPAPPVAVITPVADEPAVPAEPDPSVPVDDVPESSDVPLEELVERAMPAVVQVATATHYGSGFFIAPDLVATNQHVVAGAIAVTVTIQGGQKLSGRVAQSSPDYDLALVQVVGTAPAGATLTLGDSKKLRLGQGIVALGWAQTLTQSSMTRGVVTGLRRDGVRNLVQTDAIPHEGDSGGPLLDKAGQVVGITTFRSETITRAYGFALAINDAKPFVDRIAGTATASSLDAARGDGRTEVQRHDASTEKYASTLAAIAEKAAELDIIWSRYRTACGIAAVPAGQSREWFALYKAESPLHRSEPGGCASALAGIERQATTVRIAMIAAEEAARQGDVYPGTRRDLRRRYRLDYAAWDR